MDRLRSRMARRGYDHVVVWGDREHSANIAYLTGFDQRFEEEVLVVGVSGDPAIFVGNKSYGRAEVAALPTRSLRADLSAAYPEPWVRIQARRRFMIDTLGIDLQPDVLPFSNLAAHLPPFLLRVDAAMTVRQ